MVFSCLLESPKKYWVVSLREKKKEGFKSKKRKVRSLLDEGEERSVCERGDTEQWLRGAPREVGL